MAYSGTPALQVTSTYKKQEAETLIRKHTLWRFLETIPGALAWFALIMPFIFSMFAPAFVANFILIYSVICLFRLIKMSINLYRSLQLTKRAEKEDWQKMISLNDHPEKIEYELNRTNKEEHPKKYFRLLHLKKQLQQLQQTNQWKKSKDIYQAIIFVTYKEPYEVIYESIKSYTQSLFPLSRTIMVLAGEESDQENFLRISKKIEEQFGEQFGHYMVTIHPKNLPGEIKGKSANATWAAKQLKKYIDTKKIPYDNVIVSNFDADSVAHPSYFSELTFKYLTEENRTEKAYQPTHMFHNNIWDVPIFIRMVALSCTFWRMAESMEKEKYKSFSSRSLSFKTVMEVNYWDPGVIPEDSRQYWTAYTIYDGRHVLVPIYTPVYMDAVLSETYVKTFKSQYKQLQRWAWGVCDFPFVVLNLWYHPSIPWHKKIFHVFEFIKNSFFWSTGPLLMSFCGFVPGLINASFRDTVLAYNLPRIMSDILSLSSIGLVIICTFVSLTLTPAHQKKNWVGRLSLCFQWFFTPVVSIFLSSIPALDAQTRLLFGRHLEYKVTEKVRK